MIDERTLKTPVIAGVEELGCESQIRSLVDITDEIHHSIHFGVGVTIDNGRLHAASGAVHVCRKSSFIVFVIGCEFH